MSEVKKKLIFLDIDGTLVGFDGKIPTSTVAAVKAAQLAGHKVFICTGRAKAIIYDYLFDFGFDGIVSATGSMVEYHDKVIYKNTMPESSYKKILRAVDYENIPIIVNLHTGSVMRKSDGPHMVNAWKRNSGQKENVDMDKVFESIEPCYIDDDMATYPERYDDIVAVDYVDAKFTVDELQKKLGDDVVATVASFTLPSEYCGEITIAGDSKATAIDKVCDYLGVPLSETIAIGDSANDVSMLEHAAIGVAMGNATDDIKKIADYTTTHINDNGIANAFIHFGLIE